MYFFDQKSSKIYLEEGVNQQVNAGKPFYFLAICRFETGLNTLFYIVTEKKVFEINCGEKTQKELFANSKVNYFKAFKGMGSIVFQGKLCLIGGFNKSSERNERSFQLCPINLPQWTQGVPLNIGRSSPAVCSMDDSLYICGGWGSSLLSSIEKYKNHIWVCLSFRISPSNSCSMVPISGARVLIFGQVNNEPHCVQEVNFCRKSVKKHKNLPIANISNYNFLFNNRTLIAFDLQKTVQRVEMKKSDWPDLESFLLIREKLYLKLI